jgi:hypothetical protein
MSPDKDVIHQFLSLLTEPPNLTIFFKSPFRWDLQWDPSMPAKE